MLHAAFEVAVYVCVSVCVCVCVWLEAFVLGRLVDMCVLILVVVHAECVFGFVIGVGTDFVVLGECDSDDCHWAWGRGMSVCVRGVYRWYAQYRWCIR